jgi:hypothetical protein
MNGLFYTYIMGRVGGEDTTAVPGSQTKKMNTSKSHIYSSRCWVLLIMEKGNILKDVIKDIFIRSTK